MKPIEDKPTKPKVLLVDDEAKICASLAPALVSEGFEVVFVESGDEALTAFRDGIFDIVLMDLRMPGKSGWETFAQLAWSRPLLPVIIITELPDQSAAAKAAGVGALLEMPLEIPLLLETMRRLLAEPIEARLARVAGKPPLLDPKTMRHFLAAYPDRKSTITMKTQHTTKPALFTSTAPPHRSSQGRA